jgi:hypothetical protein
MKMSKGRIFGGLILSSLTCWGLYLVLGRRTRKNVDEQANDYFPVQSTSERAAGHPLVGVS